MKTAGYMNISLGLLILIGSFFMETTVSVTAPSFPPYSLGGPQNVANLQAMHFQNIIFQLGLGLMIFGAVLAGAGEVSEALSRVHGSTTVEQMPEVDSEAELRRNTIITVAMVILAVIGVLMVLGINRSVPGIPDTGGNYLAPEEDNDVNATEAAENALREADRLVREADKALEAAR